MLKVFILLTSLVFPALSSEVNAQDTPPFVVAYFDIITDGDTTRYYSQIIPLKNGTDMECVEEEIYNSFIESTGIDHIEFWKIKGAASIEAADKMVTEKLTIAGRKRVYFKASVSCN